MTTRQFKDRLAEHRDYPKRNVITEPSAFHFTQPGHTVNHLKGLVLEKVGNILKAYDFPVSSSSAKGLKVFLKLSKIILISEI